MRESTFNLCPASWYYAGTVEELTRRPQRIELAGMAPLVAFVTERGQPVVLFARCAHMAADLSLGRVRGERIACPLHGWEYGADGRCAHIPAGGAIPGFAVQGAFPVEQVGGLVFFFNRPEARFPLPFFAGVAPAQLRPAREFKFLIDVPWYLAAANGFDAQHFRCAHDRTLDGEPIVERPHAFAWGVRARFRVTGTSLCDRLTRLFSGPEVEMAVTNWGGNLVLVTARFRRTTSYGMVSFLPIDERRTWLRNVVWVPRSRSPVGRAFFDPLDAAIRRRFIREFVRSDVERSAGLRFDPRRAIAADKMLVDYLDWLRPLHR